MCVLFEKMIDVTKEQNGDIKAYSNIRNVHKAAGEVWHICKSRTKWEILHLHLLFPSFHTNPSTDANLCRWRVKYYYIILHIMERNCQMTGEVTRNIRIWEECFHFHSLCLTFQTHCVCDSTSISILSPLKFSMHLSPKYVQFGGSVVGACLWSPEINSGFGIRLSNPISWTRGLPAKTAKQVTDKPSNANTNRYFYCVFPCVSWGCWGK